MTIADHFGTKFKMIVILAGHRCRGKRRHVEQPAPTQVVSVDGSMRSTGCYTDRHTSASSQNAQPTAFIERSYSMAS